MRDVPSIVRRRLRHSLGSRTQRRAGVKSHGNTKPRERLRLTIQKWIADGCSEVGLRA